MSPHKYSTQLGVPQDTSLKSVKPKFHVLKDGLQKGCGRRLEFGSESKSVSSGFPSPRCGSSSYNDLSPSKAGHEKTRHCMSSKHAYSDSVDLEDFKTDEYLFWPSDCKHDWSSEET